MPWLEGARVLFLVNIGLLSKGPAESVISSFMWAAPSPKGLHVKPEPIFYQ